MFRMSGRLDPCFLLSYAVRADRLRPEVPSSLHLITREGVAFANVVVTQIHGMRPTIFPQAAGITYWHLALRLHVEARLAAGLQLQGLYFIRSVVDSRLVASIGNLLTDFRMDSARFSVQDAPHSVQLEIASWVRLALGHPMIEPRPAEHPFESGRELERMLQYSPMSFAPVAGGRRLRIAEAQRTPGEWREFPVDLLAAEWQHPAFAMLRSARLLRATRVAPIDYRWALGRSERVWVSS